jgi:glycine betaine/choline ABC-type transport system substrate-binding protein
VKKLCLLIALLAFFGIFAGCSKKESDIVVGAKDYTEQHILGQMLSLLIEANTDLTVSCMDGLASDILFASIRTGVVDVYVEYSGTVYANHLKNSDMKGAEEVYDISATALREDFNLLMLDPLGFNNTYALAVRAGTAAEHDLRTFSDLAKVSSDFVFGGSAEFLIRNDGLPNLKRLYDMKFKEEKSLDGAQRYFSIADDEIQVAGAFSTDGMLLEYDLVVLEDDKRFFPPYQGAIIIRNETVEKYPDLPKILDKLAGKLSDDIMRSLNHKADVLGQSPKSVAEGFLKEGGFIR